MSGILFFDTRFDLVTGAQRSMLTLAQGCRDRGRTVKVATLSEGPLLAGVRELGIAGLSLHAPRVPNGQAGAQGPRRVLAGLVLPWVLLQALVLILRQRPAVVMVNTAGGALYLGPWARMLRIPVIWYVRMERRQPWLFPLAGRLATRMLLVADGVRAAFTPAERERWKQRMQVLPTGFPDLCPTPGSREELEQRLAVEQGGKLPAERPRILLLGSYDPRKGHADALEAFASYRRRGGHGVLVFCGHRSVGDPYVVTLERQRTELGLDEAVVFLEQTCHARALMKLCDIAILPSAAEGLPRIVVEALAEGRRVISYPVSGVRDLVRDERCGTVLDRAEPEALAAAMQDAAERLPTDDYTDVRNQAVAHLTVDRYADRFLAICDDLSASRRSPQHEPG